MLKYKIENFTCELLGTSTERLVDVLESFFIKRFNTLHPNGYNLETGGNRFKTLSEQTRQKMSISRMGHPNYLTKEGKVKISKSLTEYYDKNPKIKLDHNGNNLPKYIGPITEDKDILGYYVNIHTNGFRKKITSKKLTLDEKLKQAISYSQQE